MPNISQFESITVFWHDVRLSYIDDDLHTATKTQSRLEMSLAGPFLADNEREAVYRARDFALDRLANLKDEKINPDLRLSSLSVSHYFISRIDSSGGTNTRHTIPFFQWKEDFPQLLVDYISSFLHRTDTLKPIPWKLLSREQKILDKGFHIP